MFRLILILTVLLAGCTTNRPSPGPLTDKLPESPDETYSSQRTAEITYLLDQAERAISQQRLTTPQEDNAYTKLLQVLARDPQNPAAHNLLNRIVETYIEWAIRSIEAGNLSKATSQLNRANSVDENHPSIPGLRHRIQTARHLETHTHKIASSELAARSQDLIQKLLEVGRFSEKRNAKILITAPSDTAGRWIYQQLNDATEDRIRATIQTGRPPSVQLSYPRL